MSVVARYLYTLRYLKPIQIWGRVRSRLPVARPGAGPAPRLRRQAAAHPRFLLKNPSLEPPHRFRFLGVERDVARAEDWNAASTDKLWLYNAHYFDDLNAHGGKERRAAHLALLKRWIAENPVGDGNGWEPYPLSLRLVNWVKWLLCLRSGAKSASDDAIDDPTLTEALLLSMAMQVRYLRRRLETHLLGNHLLANAKALVFAGAFFDGSEADDWLETGLAIMREQLPEQVLPDGGHFERSPMYHAIVLEDVLDLIHLAQLFADVDGGSAASWHEIAERMLAWLEAMCHPDGEIAFFNDAATGIAASRHALVAYASSIGVRPNSSPSAAFLRLADSGYVRAESPAAVAFLDVAPVGPDYLPGHAHADTLSFELSLFGRRMLVNSGTSGYRRDAQRQRERSTAAHNTVAVDGEDSSEVWAAFRVARRARPFDLEIAESPEGLRVACSHDGYLRLRGRVIHRREWRFRRGELVVLDRLAGCFGCAEARFHFHPEWRVTASENAGRAVSPEGATCIWEVAGGHARIDDASYHPQFGASVPNRCLAVEFSGAESTTRFRWE